MDTLQPLSHHFLIAMPGLQGDFFSRSLIYLCDHSADGAMGLVVNKPLQINLDELLQHFELEGNRGQGQPVFAGGPVQTERGFVLHSMDQRTWDTSTPIGNELGLTTSRDILTALAQGTGPDHSLVALGYAGWGPGQLEAELTRNAWLTLPATGEILFDTPAEQRLDAAGALLGVDLNLLSSQYGHA